MTELVRLSNPDEIAALPLAQRGEVITRALEESKSWLAVATKGTDPTPIAEFKAWAATVAEMTRQKGLAEEIQLDALEMVRRAERGIGVAIRNGQDAGEIARRGNHGRTVSSYTRVRKGKTETVHVAQVRDPNSSLPSPADHFSSASDRVDAYKMADAATDDAFEQVLSDARSEGNLSRANVVRKVEQQASPMTRLQKAERIRRLAAQGYNSRQMSEHLATGDGTIREIARTHGIDIPADRVTARTKRIDPERVVEETVNTLQGIEYGLGLLSQADYDAFTSEQVRAWLGALNTPARAIRVLLKELNRRAR